MKESASDIGLKNLDRIINSTLPGLTESDTRAKIIDPLFKDCLGWDESDIRRETHIHHGYLDYVFHIDNLRMFVLEAKKEGESFRIPASYGERQYKVGGAITTDKRINEAIEQAQKYCINSGVKYGVISNGQQYIIFEAFKRGEDWKNGRCIVFRSLDDIKKNFSLFWDTLSKIAVKGKSLQKYVSEEAFPLAFMIPIESLHSKDATIARNDLSQILDPFVNYIFDEITDTTQLDVLKSCYVMEKSFSDADKMIGLLFDKPPISGMKIIDTIFESEKDAGNFQRLYEKCQDFLRSKASRGSLILLMGGIGSGKTTFVHYFFNYVLGTKETIWFYVDFKNAPRDETEIARDQGPIADVLRNHQRLSKEHERSWQRYIEIHR